MPRRLALSYCIARASSPRTLFLRGISSKPEGCTVTVKREAWQADHRCSNRDSLNRLSTFRCMAVCAGGATSQQRPDRPGRWPGRELMAAWHFPRLLAVHLRAQRARRCTAVRSGGSRATRASTRRSPHRSASAPTAQRAEQTQHAEHRQRGAGLRAVRDRATGARRRIAIAALGAGRDSRIARAGGYVPARLGAARVVALDAMGAFDQGVVRRHALLDDLRRATIRRRGAVA